jgi:hypothetical protein
MTKISNQYSLTNVLTADPVNGRVGIGTASPSYPLEVKSTGVNSTIWGYNIAQFADAQTNNNGLRIGTSVATSGLTNLIAATSNDASQFGFWTFTGSAWGERLRITSGGNVGIGTSNPSSASGSFTSLDIRGSTGSSIVMGSTATLMSYVYVNTSGMALETTGTIPILFNPGGTERARINTGGELFVGTTSQPGAGSNTTGSCLGGAGYIIGQRNSAPVGFFGRGVDNGELIVFYRGTTQVGNISVTTSATAYNTGSDYRLKEDLKEIKGLDKVSAIKVYDFKWKSSDDRMDGVLAHELAEVLPYAVIGEKDGEQMQGVDYSKIVPILIKSIQELSADLTSAKQEIALLKAK